MHCSLLQDPYVLSEASEVNYVLRFFLGDFKEEESIGIKSPLPESLS